MLSKKTDICPRIKEPCIKDRCHHWLKLEGPDPQDPKRTIDKFECVFNWTAILLIENTAKTIKFTESFEIFKKELAQTGKRILAYAQQKRIG